MLLLMNTFNFTSRLRIVCMCIHVNAYVFIYMWDAAIDIRRLLWFLPVYPLRERHSHYSRSSQIQLDWLATKFSGSSCLWFSTIGVTNTPVPITYVESGDQIRIPMLAEQALKIWAISLASQGSVFNIWLLYDLFLLPIFIYLILSFCIVWDKVLCSLCWLSSLLDLWNRPENPDTPFSISKVNIEITGLPQQAPLAHGFLINIKLIPLLQFVLFSNNSILGNDRGPIISMSFLQLFKGNKQQYYHNVCF